MKSTATGRSAETAVAEYLVRQGYKVITQNWRTKTCEIDIVAQKNRVVYFVEVKYRFASAQGDGFDYITQGKLKQMHYAAQVWVSEHNWNGDYRLAAAAVSGDSYQNIEIIEID